MIHRGRRRMKVEDAKNTEAVSLLRRRFDR
jgi:hypothetical protein